MNKLIAGLIFSILLIAFVANPAPISLGAVDGMLIVLPCFLFILSLASIKNYKVSTIENSLIIAIMLYLAYLLISVLLGLMQGVPLLNILRSLGPYINFFPLVILGFLPPRLLNPWTIAAALIVVGMLQASYQIYLYCTHSYGAGAFNVLRSRITLIEPRATLPIVYAVTTLPLVFFTSQKKYLKVLAVFLVLLGLFAGAATLTRSILISITMGWIAFTILYCYHLKLVNNVSLKTLTTRFLIYSLLFSVVIIGLSLIPKINELEQGLLLRFSYHPTGAMHHDYSNGRLYEEWIPALSMWFNAGILHILFGMGSGNPFIIASGEERTYIHNLLIYCLVYGGLYGIFASLWLYFTVFKALVIRAIQAQQIIYLGFAALLVSLFCYAQLFAVHKGLAFNAMLFLMIALALSKPQVIKQND